MTHLWKLPIYRLFVSLWYKSADFPYMSILTFTKDYKLQLHCTVYIPPWQLSQLFTWHIYSLGQLSQLENYCIFCCSTTLLANSHGELLRGDPVGLDQCLVSLRRHREPRQRRCAAADGMPCALHAVAAGCRCHSTGRVWRCLELLSRTFGAFWLGKLRGEIFTWQSQSSKSCVIFGRLGQPPWRYGIAVDHWLDISFQWSLWSLGMRRWSIAWGPSGFDAFSHFINQASKSNDNHWLTSIKTTSLSIFDNIIIGYPQIAIWIREFDDKPMVFDIQLCPHFKDRIMFFLPHQSSLANLNDYDCTMTEPIPLICFGKSMGLSHVFYPIHPGAFNICCKRRVGASTTRCRWYIHTLHDSTLPLPLPLPLPLQYIALHYITYIYTYIYTYTHMTYIPTILPWYRMFFWWVVGIPESIPWSRLHWENHVWSSCKRLHRRRKPTALIIGFSTSIFHIM